MSGVFNSFQHSLGRFHELVAWYKPYVLLTSNLVHACYQANGIVVFIISHSLEATHLPTLEAVHNKLKGCFLNFGG